MQRGERTQVLLNEKPLMSDQPTQVANPKRAANRTFVQSIIPALALVNLALPVVYPWAVENSSFFEGLLGDKYLIVLGVLNGAVVLQAQLSKLISRLMAIPRVNDFITRTKWLSWLAPVKRVL